MPDELIGQAIKEVTMHEVGHTLGLRHNFKASTMLKNEQLHDTSITRKQGLVGSVMDYAPVNLAPKGVKQGDYFTTTIGPYDYWAIEYAYKPLSGGTEGEFDELQKIAAECATPGHDYATDEDLYGTSDPLINVWDLGADPMKFAQDRILLAEELLKGLADTRGGQGRGLPARRGRRSTCCWGSTATGRTWWPTYVGGEHMHRDHRGDPNGRDPLVPVKARQAARGAEVPAGAHPDATSRSSSRRSCCAAWRPTAGCTGATSGRLMQPVDYPLQRARAEHSAGGAGPRASTRTCWPASRTTP